MIKRIGAFLILIFFPSISFGQGEIIVLNGIPSVQATCSFDDCKHFPLSKSQKLESKVLITKKNNKYFFRQLAEAENLQRLKAVLLQFLWKIKGQDI